MLAKASLGIDRRTAVTLSCIAANSFQKLYERGQQCVVKDGGYFEGQLS
jgi:hypothetical protein